MATIDEAEAGAIAAALRDAAAILERLAGGARQPAPAPPEPPPTRWLTVAEVAPRLGVSESQVRRWIRTGVLPSRQLGRKVVRVDETELRAWMARPAPADGVGAMLPPRRPNRSASVTNSVAQTRVRVVGT